MGHAEGVCDSGLACRVLECDGEVGAGQRHMGDHKRQARPSYRVGHGLPSEVWKHRLASFFSLLSL